MYAAPARDPFAPQPDVRSAARPEAELSFLRTVYGWMGFGLALTGVVAALVASNEGLVNFLFGTGFYKLLLIAQILMVVVFSGAVRKVGFATAATMFTVYCATSGLTFSIYFLLFTGGSIAMAFYITGGMFALMTAYGTLTKNDLTSWGSLGLMALLGLILAGVVNWFLASTMLDMLISVVSVFVFVALTAYDTQKIRQLARLGDKRLALVGALELYLDFINLFIALLRLFGRRR